MNIQRILIQNMLHRPTNLKHGPPGQGQHNVAVLSDDDE